MGTDHVYIIVFLSKGFLFGGYCNPNIRTCLKKEAYNNVHSHNVTKDEIHFTHCGFSGNSWEKSYQSQYPSINYFSIGTVCLTINSTTLYALISKKFRAKCMAHSKQIYRSR